MIRILKRMFKSINIRRMSSGYYIDKGNIQIYISDLNTDILYKKSEVKVKRYPYTVGNRVHFFIDESYIRRIIRLRKIKRLRR